MNLFRIFLLIFVIVACNKVNALDVLSYTDYCTQQELQSELEHHIEKKNNLEDEIDLLMSFNNDQSKYIASNLQDKVNKEEEIVDSLYLELKIFYGNLSWNRETQITNE